MQEFKEHAREEVTVPPTISHTSSVPVPVDIKSSGYVMSSSNSGALPTEETFRMDYWGRFEVPSPASSNTDQVLIIDSLVGKMRETMPPKSRSKKKSFSSRFMGRSISSKLSSSSSAVDEVDANTKESSESRDDPDIAIMLTPSSPVQEASEAGSTSSISTGDPCCTSPDDPADEHTPCNQQPSSGAPQFNSQQPNSAAPQLNNQRPNSAAPQLRPSSAAPQLNGRIRTESNDFDTLPELANLKSSTEFQALSLKTGGEEGGGKEGRVQRVRLVFSGVSVVVSAEQDQHIILKKPIKSIACCAQVSRGAEVGICGTFPIAGEEGK